ncbi:acyl-CoA dehydrogenase family protein [Cupriavidus pinatubonensis]|uniref:acyl-CoA dehydrogenase family protein n=1 Tax=Cupriavidus pinatubonensis TaxID=248026 RepID=UPI003615F1ED
MTDSLLESFERPLRELCTVDALRRIEAGQDAGALWVGIDALGYTDALVTAELGGAGLTLADMHPLFFAAGRAGLSLPFAETAVARALLASAGHHCGGGCIVIAAAAMTDGDEVVCHDVQDATLAEFVLASRAEEWLLLPRAAAEFVPGVYRPALSADALRWSDAGQAVFRFPVRGADGEAIRNALQATAMAGTMARVTDLTVMYANDRKQFGRAIGKFQAVQQDVAVLASQAATAEMASRIGCASAGFLPDTLLAATAMLRACEAAVRVAAISHAVHGAIGMTEEHELGLFTRRLHESRSAGAHVRCAATLGREVLAARGTPVVDFVRTRLTAVAA